MNVCFVAAADQELFETVQWYDQQMQGLGQRFGSAVKEAVKRIGAFPEASTVDMDGFRRVFVKGFPYKIIYKIVGDDIWITAVAHGHRMPGYWKARV